LGITVITIGADKEPHEGLLEKLLGVCDSGRVIPSLKPGLLDCCAKAVNEQTTKNNVNSFFIIMG
jgi:hypothetical protein